MDTNLNSFSTKVGDESLRIPVNRTHPNVSISVIMKTRKPGVDAQNPSYQVGFPITTEKKKTGQWRVTSYITKNM
jgi:hypothetical protein